VIVGDDDFVGVGEGLYVGVGMIGVTETVKDDVVGPLDGDGVMLFTLG
jgi:hypothetical protein